MIPWMTRQRMISSVVIGAVLLVSVSLVVITNRSNDEQIQKAHDEDQKQTELTKSMRDTDARGKQALQEMQEENRRIMKEREAIGKK
jgi:hypothetical protein